MNLPLLALHQTSTKLLFVVVMKSLTIRMTLTIMLVIVATVRVVVMMTMRVMRTSEASVHGLSRPSESSVVAHGQMACDPRKHFCIGDHTTDSLYPQWPYLEVHGQL